MINKKTVAFDQQNVEWLSIKKLVFTWYEVEDVRKERFISVKVLKFFDLLATISRAFEHRKCDH